MAVTRYPPQGIRGVSVSQRNNRYGTIADYFTQVNQHICVMVQIETPKAVAAVKAIAALPDVDCIFIGPSDLAASLGHIGNAGHQKDLSLALSGARALGVALPQTAGAAQLMQVCAANGMQDLDHSALVRSLELMANHQVAQG